MPFSPDRLSVSTDQVCLAGDYGDLRKIWSAAFSARVTGVEMLGFPWSGDLWKEALSDGISVAVHGTTNSRPNFWKPLPAAIISITNLIMDGIPDIRGKYHTMPPSYFLMHEGGYYGRKHRTQIANMAANGTLRTNLAVENDPTRGSMQRVATVVRGLRPAVEASGYQISGTADVAHMFKTYGGRDIGLRIRLLADDVRATFRQVDNTGKRLFDRLHLPIGPSVHDALPVREMTAEMWHRLFDAIGEANPDSIVIEAQDHPLKSILPMNQQRISCLRSWNSRVFEIVENGLLK